MGNKENKKLDKIKIFEHKDKSKNCNLNVFYYIPDGNISDKKVIFVMSGCYRDALNYLKIWIKVADENNYIIIAPEFDKKNYSIADHEYGNIIDVEYDYSSQDIYTPLMTYDEKIKDEDKWIYHNIDEIYLEFIESHKLNKDGFIIFGHSSGSQFVHRFLMLEDSKYCKKYLCANAGLYTFYDESKFYPYGIKNLKKFNNRINSSLSKEVYILAGEQDIDINQLNSMPKDIEEGKTRYERANNYFNSAVKYAKENNIHFNWKFVSMPNVHHISKEVVPFAVKIINK